MKKIIAVSILSLMLLGVGSANSDGMRIGVGTAYADEDASRWYFDLLSGFDGRYENTPMEDCIKARRDGITVQEYRNSKVGSGYKLSGYEAHYINKDRMYRLIVTYNADTSLPTTVSCDSIEPYSTF